MEKMKLTVVFRLKVDSKEQAEKYIKWIKDHLPHSPDYTMTGHISETLTDEE